MTISRIQIDPLNAQRVFIAALGHPFGPNPERGVFFTPDAGKTWRKVLYRDDRHGASDLEISPGNPNVFISFDAGEHWSHGRGLWILDDATPVQDLVKASSQPSYLFGPRSSQRYTIRATRSGGGDSEFAAPNPPYGAIFDYFLREPARDAHLEVIDSTGKTIPELTELPNSAGVHRIVWDLRAGGATRNARGPQVLPATYTVRLTAGSVVTERKIEVRVDPELTTSAADLKVQWDALNQIVSMTRRVNEMLRTADAHADSSAWQEFRAMLARPKGLSNSGTGPRLFEQLQSLFGLIDGPNAAPTSAMMKLLADLDDAFRKAEADFRTL